MKGEVITESHVFVDYEAKLQRFTGEMKQTMLNMRERNCSEMDKALKQVGKAALEGGEVKTFSQAYYEAKGKVMIIDELLEKIGSENGA